MTRFRIAAKPILYLLVACFSGYRAVQEIRISMNEKSPTEFSAADFPQQHDGQQWICVTGRIAVEHKHVRRSNHQAHEGKDLAYVTVPLVDEKWNPEQPVHVLATYGPIPYSNTEDWAEGVASGTRSVEGQLRPDQMRDAAGMFPGVDINPDYVVINEGTKPNNTVSMIFFLALMIVFGGAMILNIFPSS